MYKILFFDSLFWDTFFKLFDLFVDFDLFVVLRSTDIFIINIPSLLIIMPGIFKYNDFYNNLHAILNMLYNINKNNNHVPIIKKIHLYLQRYKRQINMKYYIFVYVYLSAFN